MRIALITNNFIPNKGGIANVMLNVSSILTELGEKVYVFNKSHHNPNNLHFNVLSNDITLKGIFKHHIQFFYFLVYLFLHILLFFKGIKLKDKLKLMFFYCFYLKFIVRRIISIKNLVKSFKEHKIDVILSGSANIPLLYSYILSKWFKIPIVTIAHGDDFLVRYPLNIKTFILQNIQKIIVTNKIMKKFILKIHNINSNNVKIIHLGVNTNTCEVRETVSELRNNFGINNREFVILTVSRFYPRKGFETILRALRLILDENENLPIKYFIIGGGEEQKKIESLITQLNLRKSVSILGEVDDLLKNRYYKLSDLFILVPEVKKNSIEGFGIVYIEANYFKLPVIGSRSGGVKIAIDNGKSGILIDPKDEISLKERILFLYENKKLSHEMGEFGHQRVLKFFTWHKNVLEYQELLTKCVKNYRNNRE